jgi:hypothetical protein
LDSLDTAFDVVVDPVVSFPGDVEALSQVLAYRWANATAASRWFGAHLVS